MRLAFTTVEQAYSCNCMFVRWFYISTSRLTPSDAHEYVREIVNISVPRNHSLGVTGALLFTGHRFTQYLEGSLSAIEGLKHSILKDPRHGSVQTIASGPYDHRRFLTWSLAYAGPSRFVASKVENALTEALEGGCESVESLAEMLAGFAIEGHS